jgi:hypothetical protein
MLGLDPGIHTEPALTNASTGVRARRISMDHRHRRPKDAVLRTAMSGCDESESAVTVASHSSGAKTRRENSSSLRAKRSNPVCSAALDCFVANASRNDERAPAPPCGEGRRALRSNVSRGGGSEVIFSAHAFPHDSHPKFNQITPPPASSRQNRLSLCKGNKRR